MRKKRILAALMALIIVLSTTTIVFAQDQSGQKTFTDVGSSDWFHTYVENLADQDVVHGYGNGAYGPLNQLTRQQAAKMIAIAAGLDFKGKTANFPDVAKDSEFSGYIAALVETEAIDGFPDGTFGPTETITRSQATKMIVAAFGLTKGDMNIDFLDTKELDPADKVYIDLLASLGIVKGYEDSKEFRPNNNVTRAQFAKMMTIVQATAAVQRAETAGTTPESIAQAEKLVGKLPDNQDIVTKESLEERLNALKKEEEPGPKPTKPVKVTGIKINGKPEEGALAMDRLTLQLTATITPSNAANQKVTWSSDKPEFATVDEQSGLVTAVSKGTVTITATTEDGSKTDKIEIKVPTIVTNAKTLEAAVEGSADGDVIYLMPGPYRLTETLVINKSISLIGPQADVDPRPSAGSSRAFYVEDKATFNDVNEAVLTGDGADTGTGDPASKSEAENRKWSDSLFEIKAHNVTINGLTMQRTYNHIIYSSQTESKVDINGLTIVNNIVREGRGNEGIKVANSTNALVQYNFIYDIKYGGDAIEASGVNGFSILDNEIDDCSSINGTINVCNTGGKTGYISRNLIKNTTHHFAIMSNKGKGNIEITNNTIENAGTGGIFIYKNGNSASAEKIEIKITGNTIKGYANSLIDSGITDGSPPWADLEKTAAAIGVSYTLTSGQQPSILIKENVTDISKDGSYVLAFGCVPATGAVSTDLDFITITQNEFDKYAVKYDNVSLADAALEQFNTDLKNNNTWSH